MRRIHKELHAFCLMVFDSFPRKVGPPIDVRDVCTTLQVCKASQLKIVVVEPSLIRHHVYLLHDCTLKISPKGYNFSYPIRLKILQRCWPCFDELAPYDAQQAGIPQPRRSIMHACMHALLACMLEKCIKVQAARHPVSGDVPDPSSNCWSCSLSA